MKDLYQLLTMPMGYRLESAFNLIHNIIDDNDVPDLDNYYKKKEKSINTLLDYKEMMDGIQID